jgi:hypothetical protein
MTSRLIIFIIVAFCFSRCLVGDTKCCDHVSTDTISKGLFIERYRTFCAGVFGELTECYITDSTTFRQNVGSYDEHEFFRVKVNRDRIEAYNFQSSSIPDTVERKTISKTQLWEYHHSDKNCLTTEPIFGTQTITCNTDFYPASSYKTDDGYYISEVQYKCGNDYSNAVYYTDSLNFSVLIGIRTQATWGNSLTVKANSDNSFEFYNIEFKNKIDTVKAQTFFLTELRKAKLITVCKPHSEQTK